MEGDKTTWTADGGVTIDAATGVITLDVNKIEVGDTLKAVAKDKGGLEGDTDKLNSDKATKKLETATVTYDKNEGSGSMDAKTLNKGGKFTVPTGSGSFEAPDNQQFAGKWEDQDGKQYDPGHPFEHFNKASMTLKPVWEPIKVTVTYNAGEGGSGSMESEKIDKGSDYTLKSNTFYAPKYYKFSGWKVGDTLYDENGLVKNVIKDITAIAQWQRKQVTVTYDPGDGTGNLEGLTGNKDTTDMGLPYTLKKHTGFQPNDENKVFSHWQIGDSTTEYKEDAKYTVEGDIVVKAIWNTVYTVNFDVKGHGTAPVAQKIVKGGTATEPTAPTEEGWTFGGWFTDKALEKAYDFKTPVTESFTLYAKWTKDATPPAPGGDDKPGTNPGDNPGTKPGDNTPGTNPNDPNNPNQPGDPNNPNKPNDPSISNPDEQVIITVDPNGGHWNGETSIRRYPEKIGSIFILDEAPKRDGYTFVYWQGSVYQPGDKYTVKGSHTFTAVWIKDGETTDARLRRLLALTGEKKIIVPRAGVGASTTAVEPMLFPVDLLPAPKKREEE